VCFPACSDWFKDWVRSVDAFARFLNEWVECAGDGGPGVPLGPKPPNFGTGLPPMAPFGVPGEGVPPPGGVMLIPPGFLGLLLGVSGPVFGP